VAEDRKPEPPGGLKDAGAALWRDVLAKYGLSAAELRLLEAAARLVDEISELQVSLDEHGPIIKGSRGTLIAHPALRELRDHRALFARTVKQLALPAEDAQPESWTTKRARDAANARWAMERDHNERRRTRGRSA
jgi:hypothetical protein